MNHARIREEVWLKEGWEPGGGKGGGGEEAEGSRWGLM